MSEQTVHADQFVVALLRDGGIERFAKREDAPQEAVVFTSIEEISKLSLQDLDKISSRIIKAPIIASKNKEEAAGRAWTALLAISTIPPLASEASKRDGRAARATVRLLYDFDSPGKAEEKYNGLPPQAQVCLKIMARGGKREYSEAELRKLVESHGQDLRTKQEPWRIFQYYRRRLSVDKFIHAT